MSGVTLDWNDVEVVAQVYNRARESLQSAGEALLEEANETVPREFGDLAESGAVKVMGNHLGNLRVKVGYTAPYALAQHEDTELQHTGQGRAKWLQLTLQEKHEDLFVKLGRKMSR